MYSSTYRNRNKERFRTQANPDYNFTSKPQNRSNLPSHTQSHSRLEPSKFTSNQSSAGIIQTLEKHVDYLEKKLHQAEVQLDNAGNSNEWLKAQIMEKESLIIRLTSRVQEQEKNVKQYQVKYEGLQTDFSNYQLQQKVDQLNRDMSGKNLQRNQLSPFKSAKKDKFSSAFLPSPFGSPKHYEQKPSELFQSFSRDSLNDMSRTSKDPFQNALWSEWKKMKNGKSKKQKELNNLYGRLEQITEECTRQKKESSRLRTELMRAEERHKLELSKLKTRVANYIKDQKILKGKLKQYQQKLSEFSISMKEKGEGDGQDLFAYSSALQIQQIFQKMTHNLELDSSTVDIAIEQTQKLSITIQTDNNDDTQQHIIHNLQEKNKDLEHQLSVQQKNWVERLEEVNNNYMSELKDASDVIEAYKARIDQQNIIIDSYSKQGISGRSTKQPSQLKEYGIMCQIINQIDQKEQQNLLKRVIQLACLNEDQAKTIEQLEKQKSELLKTQEDYEVRLLQQRLLLKNVRSSQSQGDIDEVSCARCRRLKEKLAQRQIQKLDLMRKIEVLNQEKTHFINQYEDKINQYSHLEQETNTEIDKLKADLKEKSKSLSFLIMQTEEKGEQNKRLKEQMKELESGMGDLKNKMEMLQDKPEEPLFQD